MKTKIKQGFTLIELMIVVAIIAILAAVAIPAYQHYQNRSKAGSVIQAMGGLKTPASENPVFTGTAITPYTGATVIVNGTGSVTGTSNAITLIGTITDANSVLGGKIISLIGTEASNGTGTSSTYSWACTSNIPTQDKPNTCQ